MKAFLYRVRESISKAIGSEKLKSRKFWAAIISSIIPVINEVFGLNIDPLTIVQIVAPLLTFIFAEAWVDSNR